MFATTITAVASHFMVQFGKYHVASFIKIKVSTFFQLTPFGNIAFGD